MKRCLTLEEVFDLRKQIVLNSLYISDYKNNLGVDQSEACDFFDGFMDYIQEIAEEDGFPLTENTYDVFFGRYDNEENLENWWHCFEDCPLHAIEVN